MNILVNIRKFRGAVACLAAVIIFWPASLSAAGQSPRYGVVFGQQGNEVEMQIVPARFGVATCAMPAPDDSSVSSIVPAPVVFPTAVVPVNAVGIPVRLLSQPAVEYKEDGFDVSIDGVSGEAFGSILDASGKVSVDDILFDFDRADIKSCSIPVLNSISSMMKSRPTLKIRVEGFTDYRGAIDYNFELSVQRAYAVKDWLVDNGVESTRIEFIGKGQRGSEGDSEAQQAKNRRVDIVKVSE